MGKVIDFSNVHTDNLESSSFVKALAGLRANFEVAPISESEEVVKENKSRQVHIGRRN
ncbi:hypothetical protein [Caldisericum exile]|uniref:Uncharacterized protein n=1 Tax=Caldisericum exile (strain DSM 21853 / NBRC 104410 / AZM16c01) TaxID=511051 RepID=A0A7U6JEV2_CALEA|nr:hypothetical protein [Caldisericum exile]BAL81111.1 hypothetical protein CSE_09850 [Caldisericum exile AZM16c01]